MEMIQSILITLLLAVWVCISISFLVSTTLTIVYEIKRDKREREKAAMDLEYHKKRMADY